MRDADGRRFGQDADGAIVERQSSVRAILMRINAQQRVLSSNCF